MPKLDLKKELQQLYKLPKGKPVVVEVPALNYLMVDGEGDPNKAPAYREAVEALYQVSYTLKFMVKKGPEAIDYGVMPLEGLWWMDDMSRFTVADKSEWKWTMKILQPSFVKKAMVDKALEAVLEKKNPAALSKVRFETFKEGKAAQILHIGPFSEEGPTIAKLHAFIEAEGYRLTGKHHEIYLSDIRKAAPEKWKTIIRQPMA